MPQDVGNKMNNAGKSSFEAAKDALHNAGDKCHNAFDKAKGKGSDMADSAKAHMHDRSKAHQKAENAKDDMKGAAEQFTQQ